MEKIRFGIIGIGNMGTGHGKTLTGGLVDNAVLAAVCDINPARLKWAEENFPEAARFDNATDLFKSGSVDAVIISVPHYSHPPLAMEAFGYGINVMCEKPAGVYTLAVKEMNAKAAESGVVFGMMFNQRTNCVYRKMKEMVEKGELGNLRRVTWLITNWYRPQFYYDSGDWRATWGGEGGGVLLNQCPHNLDLLQWICGMPNKVTAFCHEGKWHTIEVEDDVTAYLEYPNGATGVFITSTGDVPGTNRFELTGDLGKLVCEDEKLRFFKLCQTEQEYSRENKTHMFGTPQMTEITLETDGENPQHQGVLQAFVNKILGKGELVARGEEGINGLTLSNAMHLSSWLGKTVTLPFDEKLFYDELKKKIEGSQGKVHKESLVAGDMNSSFR